MAYLPIVVALGTVPSATVKIFGAASKTKRAGHAWWGQGLAARQAQVEKRARAIGR